MTTLSVSPSFPIFTDRDGSPLENGYIWIGTAALNPITNPISVYWDAALTQLAAQPIRTLNGYPSNAGTPARLYVGSDYSMLVQDAKGTLVYSSPNATERWSDVVVTGADASEVNFLQAGTGAQPRTAQSKLRDVVSVKDFGAAGDGTADDTDEIQAALTAAGVAGAAVYIPGTTTFYKISDTLTVPDNVTVYGDGFVSCVKQTVREKNTFSLGNRCQLRNLRVQGDGVTTGGVDFTKNNGIVIDTAQNTSVIECWIHGCEHNGIFAKNTSGLTIEGNVIYGNAFSSNSGSDIILYSDVGSIRTNITGNFLVSNNSQGCFVNALGLDTDISVTNNFACPVDANGVVITGASIARRHSFVLGYVGGTDFGGRITCSNNISLNTRQTGVYWQSATPSGGSVTISHNYIRGAGTNALQPALAGGIYIAAQGPSDVVIGNIIETMPQTGFITAAGINMQPSNVSAPAANCTLIQGNAISGTSGHGIYIGSRSQNVQVANNAVAGYTQAAYIYVATAGFTGGGTIEFIENRAYGATAAVPGIYISRQNSTAAITICGNNFVGFNNTTATADNSGILIRDWDRAYRVESNVISTFYGGIGSDVYCNATTVTPRFINNQFISCNAAYHVSSLAGAGRIIGEGDTLDGTATYQATTLLAGSRAVWAGIRISEALVQASLNATPATGTWAVGDRVQQSVPVAGQPKGWLCTVAGAPGTWVSEGNL
jgi:hypothetical protein